MLNGNRIESFDCVVLGKKVETIESKSEYLYFQILKIYHILLN